MPVPVGVLPAALVFVFVCVFGVVVEPVVVRRVVVVPVVVAGGGVVVVPVVVAGGGVVVVAGGVVEVGVVSAAVVVVVVVGVVAGGGVVVVVVSAGSVVSVVDVVSAGVVSRLTNSACDDGELVRLTVAPTVPSTLVTSCLPGRNTTLPSKILPLWPSPRSCCSSLTAAVVAACQVSSTTIPSGL